MKFGNVLLLISNYHTLGKDVALYLNKFESPSPKDAFSSGELKIRHCVTHSVLNGNRFMYIEQLENRKNLLRVNYCTGCDVYCSTTVSPKSRDNSCVLSVGKLGTLETIVTTSLVAKYVKVKVCKYVGHKPDDSKCNSYQSQEML